MKVRPPLQVWDVEVLTAKDSVDLPIQADQHSTGIASDHRPEVMIVVVVGQRSCLLVEGLGRESFDAGRYDKVSISLGCAGNKVTFLAGIPFQTSPRSPPCSDVDYPSDSKVAGFSCPHVEYGVGDLAMPPREFWGPVPGNGIDNGSPPVYQWDTLGN